MDFDLASLETFVRLADCGSFSEVARAQEISQPAVTFRVAKLESVIGLRLYVERDNTRARQTYHALCLCYTPYHLLELYPLPPRPTDAG